MPKKKKIKIFVPAYKLAVISTLHIEERDSEFLTEKQKLCLDNVHIPIIKDTNNTPFEHSLTAQLVEGHSKAFIDILRLCHSQGFDYVRFDAIGDEIKGLPTFDW